MAGSTGFTFVELLVAMLVFSLLMVAPYSFLHSQFLILRAQGVKLNVKESSDVGMDFIQRDLRMAGARPVAYPGEESCPEAPPPDPPPLLTCSGFERITAADATSITFQYDFRGDNPGDGPDGCPDDPGEVITYFYESSSQEIKRASGSEAPQPLISQVTNLSLRYFQANGTEIVPATPEDRANIHSIDISLTVGLPHPDPRVGGQITSTLTSTVYLPNPPC